MPERPEAEYHCTQLELYAVCRIGLGSYREQISDTQTHIIASHMLAQHPLDVVVTTGGTPCSFGLTQKNQKGFTVLFSLDEKSTKKIKLSRTAAHMPTHAPRLSGPAPARALVR